MDRMELFARIQLEQEETILLIIDIQTKLMAAMDARDQVCQNTGILLTTARELQIPVVVTEQYPRGLGYCSVTPTGIWSYRAVSQGAGAFCT